MALDMKFNIPTRKPTTEKVMESEANELNFATEETGNKIKFGDRKDTKPVVVASGSSGGKSESKDMSFDLDQQIKSGFEHTTEFTKAYHDETSKIQKLRQQTGSDRAAQSFLKSMGYDGSAAGLNDFDAFMEDRKKIVEGVNETHRTATGEGQTWAAQLSGQLGINTSRDRSKDWQSNLVYNKADSADSKRQVEIGLHAPVNVQNEIAGYAQKASGTEFASKFLTADGAGTRLIGSYDQQVQMLKKLAPNGQVSAGLLTYLREIHQKASEEAK